MQAPATIACRKFALLPSHVCYSSCFNIHAIIQSISTRTAEHKNDTCLCLAEVPQVTAGRSWLCIQRQIERLLPDDMPCCTVGAHICRGK
jgi:hypothetical protein